MLWIVALLVYCRFIPNRSSLDIEVGHFRLVSASDASDVDDVFESVDTDYQKHLSDALGVNTDSKILSFSEKAPVPKEGQLHNFWFLWSVIDFVNCHYRTVLSEQWLS